MNVGAPLMKLQRHTGCMMQLSWRHETLMSAFSPSARNLCNRWGAVRDQSYGDIAMLLLSNTGSDICINMQRCAAIWNSHRLECNGFLTYIWEDLRKKQQKWSKSNLQKALNVVRNGRPGEIDGPKSIYCYLIPLEPCARLHDKNLLTQTR